MMSLAPHQYIDRATGRVETETLFADRLVNTLYAADREQPTRLFTLLTSARVSSVLGWVAYDAAIGSRLARAGRFYRDLGINLDECLDPPHALDTARKVFERKIRYWEARPMPDDPDAVVSPADARVLVGSFSRISQFFIKEKFFTYAELIGAHKPEWLAAFRDGDVAVFRLTPDKYHYNHTPAAGRVLDFYEIAGEYRPCNPGAIMASRASFSKNRRVVTVIDTDVPGGTGVGQVAVIEVAALMIGDIVQCYSEDRYDNPREVTPGIMPDAQDVVVSPADARVLVGSFSRISQLFIKEKFFTYAELIGAHKPEWLAAFRDGDVAVFRLTPDKYHYNHTPAAGRVLDFYEIAGEYRPCNPGAIMSTRASFSKNRRVVTVIDTDVPGGTGAGRVAVIEVAALMIGDIVQCYSEDRYDNPREVTLGIFLKKGMPKSLYRPGSSTDILIFQKGRVTFSEDILYNLHRTDAATRFSEGFGRPLVETEVRVRQEIARRNPRASDSHAKETGA